jgi:hypothetical protein
MVMAPSRLPRVAREDTQVVVSIPVALEALRAAIGERGPSAYLLTTSDDGRPHAVHVALAWDGDRLAADVGKRSAANASARPAVSLLYSVRTADDYSLIVDGTAVVAAEHEKPRLLITPTKAVLHRAAAAPDRASTCNADCVPLVPPADRRPR